MVEVRLRDKGMMHNVTQRASSVFLPPPSRGAVKSRNRSTPHSVITGGCWVPACAASAAPVHRAAPAEESN